MPSTRALVLDGVLSGSLHEGFPTSPGLLGLTRLQHGGIWVHKTSQVGAVEVSLGGDPAVAHVPALMEGFLDHRPATFSAARASPAGC